MGELETFLIPERPGLRGQECPRHTRLGSRSELEEFLKTCRDPSR
jgi:hypothetical protein